MVGEFDPDKTESRNELCWRRNSLLADSQRHPARLPDRCCCCSSRHPLPRVRARACCRRSIARVRLLDHEKVGLPSLNPLRHSCRGPRLRNPLQPYRRSPPSSAAPSRPLRLPCPPGTKATQKPNLRLGQYSAKISRGSVLF